jgi:2-polyprenyl-3-methyl-5-hydroxy-6-metoxy-1,4-benzoquinol methylase
MGTEKDSKFYDAAYHRAKYLTHYTLTRWYERFQLTANRIGLDERVLEIGCGTGQLANLLFDEQKRTYKGYDFSERAIEVCNGLDLDPMSFEVGNAYNHELYKDYDVFLCCETLEHLQDKEVLKLVEKGKKIVLSLPDFAADNHLFHIQSKEDLISRYAKEIKFSYIEKVDAWYVAEGVKI